MNPESALYTTGPEIFVDVLIHMMETSTSEVSLLWQRANRVRICSSQDFCCCVMWWCCYFTGNLLLGCESVRRNAGEFPVPPLFEQWELIDRFKKEVTASPSLLQEGLSAAWVPRDPLPECGESSGRDPRDMNHTKGGLVIFTANSHPSSRELGKRISEWVHEAQSGGRRQSYHGVNGL